MMTRLTCVIVASIAPLAGAALSASVIGCTSSNNNAGPVPAQEAGIDASEASDASTVDSGTSEAGTEAGPTIKLTWQVASGQTVTTEGPDGGGGRATDAASDAPSDAASDAPTDAASDGPSDAAAAPDAGSDAAASGAPDAGVGDGGVQGIAGVAVCVYQNSAIPCVMTDADGIFTISGLPPVSDLVLTFRKDGYLPVLTAIATPHTDMNGLSSAGGPILMTSSTVSPVAPVPIDAMNKGSVTVAAIILGSSGKPGDFTGDVGAKVSLSPMTGSGPYFLNQTNTAIVPSATSMIYDGAVYFNLDPGNYEVTFDDPNHTCSPISLLFGGYGFPVPPASVKFPILAGYTTNVVAVYCTAKSMIVNTADAN